MSCLVCWEEKPDASLVALSTQCSHECCRECAVRWINKAERAACETSVPVCPFCQQSMNETQVLAVLGRPFRPIQPTAHDDEWLAEHTQSCPHCGVAIQKVEGSCDLMECLCGMRFCYACGNPQAQCPCSTTEATRHHYYWDNCFDRQASRMAPPVASKKAGHDDVDLQGHLEQRREEFARQNDVTTLWFGMCIVAGGLVVCLGSPEDGRDAAAVDVEVLFSGRIWLSILLAVILSSCLSCLSCQIR
ncbi:expressed unknown protein [Seminavis robusta]|uniref:RING-type domain-containing protein n=1 Tax=Seminavis robusta TaxID=568900 RepID=A0A9N8HFH6_9STRA|nr:expressed unknown protein [Seminavis robusta]|eukprot:Sro350_g123680.1 n/a (247) ;mRNA; f:20139-20879